MNFRLRAVLLSLLVFSTSAGAGLFSNGPSDDYLSVDQAFSADAMLEDGQVDVRWRIADGYYLYKHALKFQLAGDSGASLGTPQIPAGDKHTDEYFGEVQTYRHQLVVPLPFTRSPSGAAPSKITIQYQGCADAGLCYPPQTRVLSLNADAVATAGASTQAAKPEPFVAEQDHLAGLLSNGNLIWTLLSFLGLGLLLAFTPCVLPMIPILSGIIVGRGQSISAWRGFSLSFVYVIAMALAYTVFGVLAGLFGANLQAALQSPWVLTPFAAVFVLLACSMFGLYTLQMPNSMQSRLNQVGQGGGLAGAALMGFVSALIVGPCLAPPLAGALLYIGSSGDAVLGGAALFALGLGMGVPLIVLGTVGGGALPKAGPWMDQIKVLFGVILLGVAIWLLTRILPGPAVLALWAVLLAGYGVYLGALEPAGNGAARLAKAAGVLGLVYAVILLVGAAMGAANPLQPLQALSAGTTPVQASSENSFRRVKGLADLNAALETAKAQGRPVVVDFYADWCVECVQMEHTVFNTAQVRAALEPVVALQVDVTKYNAADRKLLKSLNVLGPPTLLFFSKTGAERKNFRLVGAVSAQDFVAHLQKALDL